MKWFIYFTLLLCFESQGKNIRKSIECEKSIAVTNRKAKEFHDYKRRAERARRVDDSAGERYRAASRRAKEAVERAKRAGGPSSDIGYLEDAAQKWKEARRIYQEISAEFFKYLDAYSQVSADSARLCHAYYLHEEHAKKGS